MLKEQEDFTALFKLRTLQLDSIVTGSLQVPARSWECSWLVWLKVGTCLCVSLCWIPVLKDDYLSQKISWSRVHWRLLSDQNLWSNHCRRSFFFFFFHPRLADQLTNEMGVLRMRSIIIVIAILSFLDLCQKWSNSTRSNQRLTRDSSTWSSRRPWIFG